MRSVRSISTTRDSSVRPNLRNSTAGSSASSWHTDFSSPDEGGVGFGFTNLRQRPPAEPCTERRNCVLALRSGPPSVWLVLGFRSAEGGIRTLTVVSYHRILSPP